MSFKSNHSKMFLEHKAIPIGYSGRISSLPTIFCRNPVRETNGIKIPQEFRSENQAATPIKTQLNQKSILCHFLYVLLKIILGIVKDHQKRKRKWNFCLNAPFIFTHVTKFDLVIGCIFFFEKKVMPLYCIMCQLVE